MISTENTSAAGVNEDVAWLEKMEKTFTQIAGEDRKIDFDEFKRALNIKESFFAERFFQLFDQDGSGTIELQELLDGLHMLTGADAARKLKFLFDVYDVDGNGSIDKYELMTVLQSSVQESSLSVSDTDLEVLTDVLFQSADTDGSGSISFDKLKKELEKHPGLLENLTIGAAQWLKPRTTETKEKRTFRYLTMKYWRNNSKKGILFLLYFLVNIALFVLGCYNYRTSNGFIIVARGCGMALNFNCSFVLVCMLRRCITFIRSFKKSQCLPLDQHILLHKVVGMMIGLLSLIHSLAHVGNAALVSRHLNLTVPEFLITTKADLGWVYGLAPLSGVILGAIIIVIIICSLPFIRRSGKFQVFYWTHILYIPFWVLIIIHAKNFWIWFIVPGVIFLVEKISRSKILKLAAYGETHIVEVNLLPSKVTHLVISKPPRWRYRPGDYVFIQIPDIALNEWHPFTISSAPELQGFFWLHVRSAGHWTNKLYEYFEEYNPVVELAGVYNKGFSESLHNMETGMEHGKYRKSGTVRRKSMSRRKSITTPTMRTKTVRVKVYIDGPFGTSTRDIFETEHAILIGSGIGVTPFASILQSIIYRFQACTITCSNCGTASYTEHLQRMKLKKVDFIWINRDQRSFEWFMRLLTDIELEQSRVAKLGRILDMHMYMTSAHSKTDMKGVGLQMAIELLHKKENRDVLTGLKTKTHAGRPNFPQLFHEINSRRQGKVKVFLCGPPALAKDLKELCSKFHFEFCKEHF